MQCRHCLLKLLAKGRRGLCFGCWNDLSVRSMYKTKVARKEWNAKEREYLRKNFLVMTAAEIAKELGRTKRSIYTACERWGFVHYRCKPKGKLEEEIRFYVSAGCTDGEIAEKVGLKSNHWVCKVRRRMGLQSAWMASPAKRQEVDRKRCEAMDVSSFGEYAWTNRRVKAAKKGWPGAESDREVQILDILLYNGSATMEFMSREIGHKDKWWDGGYRCLKRLRAIGMVVRENISGRKFLYKLAPGVTKFKRKGSRSNESGLCEGSVARGVPVGGGGGGSEGYQAFASEFSTGSDWDDCED